MAKKTPATKKAETGKKTMSKTTSGKETKSKTIKPIKEKLTKTQLMNMLAEQTDLNKKDIVSVFEQLEKIINASLKKNAVGEFTLPGLAKIITAHKKATKARKGINPFTKEETTFKAKPARTTVKIRPLKKLKDMVV